MAATVRCSACGAENPADGRFCLICDDSLVAEPRTPSRRQPVDPRTGDPLEFAGIVPRGIAFCVDWSLIAIAAAVLGLTRNGGLASVLPFVYFVALTGSMGQTVGKRLMGIEVRKADGGKADWGGVALREIVGRWLSKLIFFLGYMWALWDDRSQTWHDKIAGTVVVKTPSKTRGPLGGRTAALRRTVDAWSIPADDIREQIKTGVNRAFRTSADAMASWAERERPVVLERHSAPDGTITVAFVAIHDSDTLSARLGSARLRELVDDVSQFVRGEAAKHDGTMVKSLGDGFMLVFRSARKALQFSASAQRAAASYRAMSDEGEPHLSVGLHTGEVLHDDADSHTGVVGVAARVADEAGPGEILVTGLLKALCDSTGDFRFDAGRMFEASDGEIQTAYQVEW